MIGRRGSIRLHSHPPSKGVVRGACLGVCDFTNLAGSRQWSLPVKPNVAAIPSCVHVAIKIKANRTIRQRAPKNVRDVKSSFSATERVGAPGGRVIVLAEIEIRRKVLL